MKIRNPRAFFHKHYHYYISKTSHGSTLSTFIHNSLSIDLDHKKDLVMDLFVKSSGYDFYDNAGGSTSEGIHVGLMAGTIHLIKKYFAGVKTHEKGISIDPWFPDIWKKLSFNLVHQGILYNFNYENKGKKVHVTVKGKRKTKKYVFGVET